MKHILNFGEIIKTKSGLDTNLLYIEDAEFIGKSMRQVLVECIVCKKRVIKLLASIRSGTTNSCGDKRCKLKTYRTPFSYKIGEKITDYYSYLGEDLEKSTSNHRYILVECICGTKTSSRIDNVKNNEGCKNCGRIKRRNTYCKNTEDSLIKALYNSYASNAKKRNYDFQILFENFKELIFKECYYCGDIESNEYKRNYRSIKYNGIDRLDNTKSYYPENIVTCCGTCNFMKNKSSLDDFYSKIEKIFNRLKK